jgi:FkbM family methyltransferase
MMSFLRKFQILRIIWSHPLNRRRKLLSILIFLRFQFIGRVNNSRIEVEWIHGLRFYVAPGETGMTINLYCAMSEPNEMLFMLHFLHESDVFFDIGANAGSYSLLAAGISKSNVYSFEPVFQTRQKLLENLKLNGLPTKFVQSCALGARQGKVQITESLDAINHVVRASEDLLVDSVELQTLDSYAMVAGVSLIKVDVEGYEMEILRGATSFLEMPALKALIVETNGETKHYGSSDSEIEIFLAHFGFSAYGYDPTVRKLTLLKAANTIGNTIFVRDLDDVITRISSGPRVSIHKTSF